MDVDGFLTLLGKIEDGEVAWKCRDLTAPSPLSHAVCLRARPYAFLDGAGDAEGRRTRSISMDRHLKPRTPPTWVASIPEAIDRVKSEAWPEVGNHDELHDAWSMHGC